ncbi:MAG: oxygenase MpaB family protein [Actinomycetota bacterium]
MIGDLVATIRNEGGTRLRNVIAGEQRLDTSQLATRADPGLYGPSSAVWRVHGEASMLIGGLRALMLQTLHPLAMAGVAEHSDYRHDPWGRLHRTGHFIGATTYGNTATAERTIAMVRAIHERVEGHAPDGRPYSATDPHLLRWVHVTEVDSFLAAYDRYAAGRLTDAERDQYVAEMGEIATRLGADDVPTDMASLQSCIEDFRPELRYDPQAQEAMRFLMRPPVPLLLAGAYGIVTAGAVGLLPGWAQRQLRLPVPPGVEPIAVRPAAMLFTRGIGWLLDDDFRREREASMGAA